MRSSSFLQFRKEIKVKIQSFKPRSSATQFSLVFKEGCIFSYDVFLKVQWQFSIYVEMKSSSIHLIASLQQERILNEVIVCHLCAQPPMQGSLLLLHVFSAIHVISFFISMLPNFNPCQGMEEGRLFCTHKR